MMRALKAVNVEVNPAGWYTTSSTNSGSSFLTPTVVDQQMHQQQTNPTSVCIVFDAARTTNGKLALKAFRLTDTYMASHSKHGGHSTNASSHQPSAAKPITVWSDLLEEVPIRVHNSHLVHAFLYEVRNDPAISCDVERLSLSANQSIDKNLELVSGSIEEYANEQTRYTYYLKHVHRQKQQQQLYFQKQREENELRQSVGKPPLPEEDLSKNPLFKPLARPSRMENFVISNKINMLCSHITSASKLDFNKMLVVESINKT